MSSATPTTDCRYCGKSFSPRGIGAHEQWCEQNPNRGTPPEQQRDETGSDPEPTLSDQTSDDSGLPTSDTLRPEQESTGDSGKGCPLCGHDEVIDADEARRRLTREAGGKLPEKADVALALSEHYCTDPQCGAVWTERSEAVTMEAVMNA